MLLTRTPWMANSLVHTMRHIDSLAKHQETLHSNMTFDSQIYHT